MTAGGFLHTRGPSGRTVVLLPGFATDHRIFDGLFPGDGRIVPRGLCAGRIAERLALHLAGEASGPVTILGWSLGAFVAAEFACRRPKLVERLVLVGARRRYDAPALSRFRRSLSQDRERCLGEFYARCFLPTQRADYRRFREGLLPSYLREMDSVRLFEDLDYLGASEIRPETLPPRGVAFVHGAHDVVAPADEARALAAKTAGSAFHLLPGAAHAAFLSESFAPLAAPR